MSSSSSQSMVDFWGVITESKRIINAHSRHFLALSVLFLLPLSFSLTVFPTLLHTFTSPEPNRIVSLLRLNRHLHVSNSEPFFHHLDQHHHKTLIFSLLFSSFILLLAISAIGSITYSVFHGFYGRPVKLASAIKSLFQSFLPLLATFMAAQIVIFFIFAFLGLIAFLNIKGFELIMGLGEIAYDSVFFENGVMLLAAVLFGLVLVYVNVSWFLVSVIVVVESKWGFAPLVRSRNLVRGMRWVALSLTMFFGFFAVVLLWLCMVSADDSESVREGWRTWAFIVRTVATCAVLTVILLHSIAATTVLYMYCKALHGELAGEIADEFSAEYVSLPFDHKKVPHVVCFVQ